MSDRISNELEHGKKLLEGGAEAIWNWDSPAGKVRADRRADLIAKYSLADKKQHSIRNRLWNRTFFRQILSAYRC
ncbi:MAG: hypothetical protein IPJ93_10055 [Bacteroidota bacterium]|nr:MAG: hypothetical protein IPJ93_10055 [Bacteroidota bacterium]